MLYSYMSIQCITCTYYDYTVAGRRRPFNHGDMCSTLMPRVGRNKQRVPLVQPCENPHTPQTNTGRDDGDYVHATILLRNPTTTNATESHKNCDEGQDDVYDGPRHKGRGRAAQLCRGLGRQQGCVHCSYLLLHPNKTNTRTECSWTQR